ncbi:MAG: hypothetical protein ABJH52_09700 [Henriciella sp.]
MSNKPLDKLKDGMISATIWQNETEEGKTRYSVTIARSYTDGDDKWHETNSFSTLELLMVSRLAGKAYDRIAELKAAARAA